MALFSFSNAIMENKPIEIYNYGKMKRDFTYIDDVIEAVYRLIEKGPLEDETKVPHTIFNIGNHHPVPLLDFVDLLEKGLGKKAIKKYVPMQPGDVTETFADIEDLIHWINYKPQTSVEDGVMKFVDWYKDYYKWS